MNRNPSRRRLRSASVHLGTLATLALVLSGCDTDYDDDDDCALGPIGGGGSVVAVAMRAPGGAVTTASGTVATASTGEQAPRAAGAVPVRGGFGTHLASCGG